MVGLLWNNGTITTTTGTAFVSMSGHTTTPTNTITLKCASGESFRDTVSNQATALAFSTTNGVSFTLPSGTGGINYLEFDDANFILDGIQFKDPNSTSNSSIVNFGGANARLQNCLFDGFGQSGGADMVSSNTVSSTIVVANCLVVDREVTATAGRALVSQYTTSIFVNTAVVNINGTTGCVGMGFLASSGTATVINCIVSGYDASGSVVAGIGTLTVAVSFSLFSAASLTASRVTTGSGCLFSKTAANQFVSATTDFRLKTGSSAIDAGTTDSTDIPSSDDIAKSTRPQGAAWDIGPWELNQGIVFAGVSGTGSVAPLKASLNPAPSGVVGTVNGASPSPTISVKLSGVAGTGSTATVHASLASGPRGVAGTGAVAQLSGGDVWSNDYSSDFGPAPTSLIISIKLSSIVGTSSVGLAPSTITKNLAGNVATGSTGRIQASISATLTGVTATGSAGQAKTNLQPIIGVAATGSATAPNISIQRTVPSSAMTASVGSLKALASPGIGGIGGTGQTHAVMVSTFVAPALSNIHIGLSAWVTGHAYNLNDRVSNGGQAYHCITTGTSGSGPSGTTANIIDGTVHWKWLSAIDFSSVQAWSNALPIVLTQPMIGYLWNDGGINLSDPNNVWLTLNGHVTTSSNTITLACAPGESIRDSLAAGSTALTFNSNKGVSIVLPSTPGNGGFGINYIDVWDANVIFDGLQFADPISNSASTVLHGQSATTITIRNCIFDGYAQVIGPSEWDSEFSSDFGPVSIAGTIIGSVGTVQISNCLIIDRQSNGAIAAAVSAGSNGSFAVNCTFVSTNLATGYGFQNDLGGVVRNCIFVGYANAVGGSALVDHSLFSASTVGLATDNGNNKFNINAANQFISVTNDFRLSLASNALDAATTDLSDIPAATDIAGHSRPQGSAWDSGSWELLPFGIGIGVAATGSLGRLIDTIQSKITSVAATGAAQSPTISIGFDFTIAITGVSATGSPGSPTILVQATVSSVFGIAARGVIGVSIPGGATLSGLAATGNIGSLTLSQTLNLSSASATGSVGNLIKTQQISQSGVNATGQSGSLNITMITSSITGVTATSGSGVLTSALLAMLTGINGAGSVSNITGQASTPATLTAGIAGIGSVGTAVVTLSQSISILGVNGSGVVASIALQQTLTLTSISATAQAATGLIRLLATINGLQATGSVPSVLRRGTSINGAEMIGLIGALTATLLVPAPGISNIHIGLANWVTGHGYTVGNRAAKAGLAYHCITAGTSSSGPSGTGSNISDGTAAWKFLSAIDFTSIQSWADAIPSVVSTPIVGLLWNRQINDPWDDRFADYFGPTGDSAFTTTAGTPFLSLHSHTTTLANSITLTCAAGESFRDRLSNRTTAFSFNPRNGVAFALPATTGNCNYFDITDANVILDGLQIQDPNDGSNSTLIRSELGATNLVLQNSLIDGYAQPTPMLNFNAQVTIRNCLIIDRQANASDFSPGFSPDFGPIIPGSLWSSDFSSDFTGLAIWSNITVSGAGSILINNTIINITNTTTGCALIDNSGNVVVNRNNYWLGYSTPICGSGGAQVSTDHCAFSQANFSYAASVVLDAGNNLFNCQPVNQFVNSLTDFRTNYAANGLDKAFTDITDVPSLSDIANLMRPQGRAWDIGAWELLPLATGLGAGAIGTVGSLTITASSNATPSAGALGQGQIAQLTHTGQLVLAGISSSGLLAFLSDNLQKAIVGKTITAQAGSLTDRLDARTSTSVTATAAVGTLVSSLTIILNGLTAIGASGNIVAFAGTFVFVTGTNATGQAGSPSASLGGSSNGLVGNAACGNLLQFSISTNIFLTGIAAVGQAGPVLTQPSSLGMTPALGTAAIAQVGVLTVQEQATIAAIAASGQVATIAGPTNSHNLVGSGSTGGVGGFNAAPQVIPALTGIVASSASASLFPALSKTTVGLFGNAGIGSLMGSFTVALGSISALTSIGTVKPVLLVNSLGIAASASVGTLHAPDRSILIGSIAAQGFAGAFNTRTTLVTGILATLQAATLQSSETISILGIAGSLSAGTLTSITSAHIGGVSGTCSTSSLSVRALRFFGPTATGQLATLSGTEQSMINGVNAASLAGTVRSTVQTFRTGIACTGALAGLQATLAIRVGGLSSSGLIGFPGQVGSTPAIGCTAAGGVGALAANLVAKIGSVQAAASAASLRPTIIILSAGVGTIGLVGTIAAQSQVAPRGVSANGAIGTTRDQTNISSLTVTAGGTVAPLGPLVIPHTFGVSATVATGFQRFQLFALPPGRAAIGSVGALVARTVIVVSGCMASGAVAAIGVKPQAMPISVAGQGQCSRPSVAITRSAIAGVSASATNALPIARLAMTAFASVSAIGSVARLQHQAFATLFGIGGSCVAGITYGWLILVHVTATLAGPTTPIVRLIASPVLDDDQPYEIDAYFVPQVITLLYPVNSLGIGNAANAYFVPQLINIVVNE